MLPATLAESIKRQIRHYLEATFEFSDEEAGRALSRFIDDPKNGLFKGPWLSLKRPFRPAGENFANPFLFAIPFHPFIHQATSWERLSSAKQAPRTTVITTGTSSGKTECFLYPLLDHCLRERRRGVKGIKAIVLYPQNALASDQEKRFAKTIWKTAELQEAGITVGLYTGRFDPENPGASRSSGTVQMGEDHGISNQVAQQENPPDILLTNYKMLDYLLMRPQDQQLWRNNTRGVLQYLVLDELHTYDGAQGSDVACLIRRVKERLDIARGELCAVGTSATIQDTGRKGESAKVLLAKFVSKLFEEDIAEEAIIGEDRLDVSEIVEIGGAAAHPSDKPLPAASKVKPLDDEDRDRYVRRMAVVWQGPPYDASRVLPPEVGTEQRRTIKGADEGHVAWQLELARWLKQDSFFGAILDVSRAAETAREEPLSWGDYCERLSKHPLDFRLALVPRTEERTAILASFLALVAEARELRSGFIFPLVPTQVQLWVRELARVGRVVSEQALFSWLDEPVPGLRALPAFHCAECGESGWISAKDPDNDTRIATRGVQGFSLIDDPQEIYQKYFGFQGVRSPRICIFSPWPADKGPALVDGNAQVSIPAVEYYVNPAGLVIREGQGPCPLTGDEASFRIKLNTRTRDKDGVPVGSQGCPHCGSEEGVFFIGTRSATIASVGIDELFGSPLNTDPKLLAFTDSVQDAAHRAGFFGARTYNFTLRTALQHFISTFESEGVPLAGIGEHLLNFWGERYESKLLALANLIPPDLREYPPFEEAMASGQALTADIRQGICQRLSWQITEEFSLMQTHGRTMEKMGACALGWKSEYLEQTLAHFLERLEGVDTTLSFAAPKVQSWILGLLQRYRERGALYHEYLVPWAQQGWWGKRPRGARAEERELYPPWRRYYPRLIVTGNHARHESILAGSSSGRVPWAVKWTRRALDLGTREEVLILDLLGLFLRSGCDSGLLKRLHQDGQREYLAISDQSALLVKQCTHYVCSETGKGVIRPVSEDWSGVPSLEYYGDQGLYHRAEYNQRQLYYQKRYEKGVPRRVFSAEHTGLLKTEEREELEKSFSENTKLDSPNVLTCTSTLEMGINIGDLSSTMLCALPPNTSNYVQRIGRAGRATGTALIVSIINQRPHDLFFFGRPQEMLKGKIDCPGCWLDAAAVLTRQYFAYCFDRATKEGVLESLPVNARRLAEEFENQKGALVTLFDWMTKQEDTLRSSFLNRLSRDIAENTRERFLERTAAEALLQQVTEAVAEFLATRRELLRARERLQRQLDALGPDESEARQEIATEQRILRSRSSQLDSTRAMELLTDHGLLPNYAFPERGVRFQGFLYNPFRKEGQKSYELTRGAATAIKELAPRNFFYTHQHRFDIQQIGIGSREQPLVEEWAVCGPCGHMRQKSEMSSGASPSCPQCGKDGIRGAQSDLGQVKRFLQFPRSEAVSYMDLFESFSGDGSDERNKQRYEMVRSFDHTDNRGVGAVGESTLPFGIEYRAMMVMREVNVGYQGRAASFEFGPRHTVPGDGFKVCVDCGVVEGPGGRLAVREHRRSCAGRRRTERHVQAGGSGERFTYESVYLYRELKSEAIRVLLPVTDQEDVDSIIAATYLGLRLRFEGDPSHLLVSHECMLDASGTHERHYMVIMDGVPGGTGYLKALYEERSELANGAGKVNGSGRPAEGVIDLFRRAVAALESCECRRIGTSGQDTDGCYRCIRSYHLQYRSEQISRDRAIRNLRRFVEASAGLEEKSRLEEVQSDSLFASLLEKRFVDTLERHVKERGGNWSKTILRGKLGYRFSLAAQRRVWELEIHPRLGPVQGVEECCEPDFILSPDDSSTKHIAIFTDGKEFHVDPNNRLGDDFKKRRAILRSGQYWVWNITWEDLGDSRNQGGFLAAPLLSSLERMVMAYRNRGRELPLAGQLASNGYNQLWAFLEVPNTFNAPVWQEVIQTFIGQLHSSLSTAGGFSFADIQELRDRWKCGAGLNSLPVRSDSDWIINTRLSEDGDLLSYARIEDILAQPSRYDRGVVLARLEDADIVVKSDGFIARWQRFLSACNLFQFSPAFSLWATSEAETGGIVEFPAAGGQELDDLWREIERQVCSSVRPFIREFASAQTIVPAVAFYNDNIADDAFAELAWPAQKFAILEGDQCDFARKWQDDGWTILPRPELQLRGAAYVIEVIKQGE